MLTFNNLADVAPKRRGGHATGIKSFAPSLEEQGRQDIDFKKKGEKYEFKSCRAI
jgi:hypothetical protein